MLGEVLKGMEALLPGMEQMCRVVFVVFDRRHLLSNQRYWFRDNHYNKVNTPKRQLPTAKHWGTDGAMFISMSLRIL